MSDDLRTQIRDTMALKESDELLEIWQGNDRLEWSDEAFEAIREILKERAVDIPEQNEPVYEHNAEKQAEDYNFSDEELKIIDDENPPDFYDPLEVLKLSKWIEWAAKAVIAITILYNLMKFPYFKSIVASYFIENPNPAIVFTLAFVLMVTDAAISIGIQYFVLRAFAHILRILMAMEFRSRKGI